jgi:hypothetical protein
MFVGTGPKKDERIRDKFPMLSFNEGVRLSCEGGIQHGRNRYFTFAPPRVLLDGGDDATTVWADGTVLVPHSERLAVFELPPEIVISGKLLIEAKHGSEVLARRSIYFSDESVAKQIEPPWCDRFGRYVEKAESNDAIVSGSIVKGTQPTFEGFFLPDLHFIRGGILIGSEAGQIASLPQEPFPSNWEPVWLVTIERRGTVLFCGKGISDAEPKSYRFADRRRLKHWKEVLWHWRRRITPPTHPSLAALWQRYQREARNL